MSTPPSIVDRQTLLNPDFHGDVLDWRALAANMAARPLPAYPLYPGVNPGWDNEPRRTGRGRVFAHASPRGYRDWLRATIHGRLREVAPADRIVFINAWNEWAEGAVLEPDTRLGHAWLTATRDAATPPVTRSGSTACVVIHAWYIEMLDEVLDAIRASEIDWRIVVTTAPEHEAAVRSRLASMSNKIEIEVLDNRGRDIRPFLHVANRLLDEGVDVVLKLHTKRTTHRSDGAEWGRALVHHLLEPGTPALVIAEFERAPRLGVVAPDHHLCQTGWHMGANSEALTQLRTMTGGTTESADDGCRFVAGSMGWWRLEALRPLLDAHLADDLFEPELGQIDGTWAHATERFLVEAVRDAGYIACERNQIPGIEIDPRLRMPYAKSSG